MAETITLGGDKTTKTTTGTYLQEGNRKWYFDIITREDIKGQNSPVISKLLNQSEVSVSSVVSHIDTLQIQQLSILLLVNYSKKEN